MTRALMLLIAAAAASSAAGASPCKGALMVAQSNVLYSTDARKCAVKDRIFMNNFNSINGKCYNFKNLTGYDAETCDPLQFNYSQCMLQAAKLLKPDNTFDYVAFETISLKNQCSTDTNFSKAYPNCKNSTMKYLNAIRLFVCLNAAVP
ncbi:uncharacterized protein LOC108678408 [Hyalella azteca]|uniref:Uncharacterized protein LOC108678408 n=1 Tax=Hyalella azteca TaxID=294128 RepID=A0A8B7P8L3_HYAAZ|nr:uncharacterized protein LOC108678408 [Hyalella azteca]